MPDSPDSPGKHWAVLYQAALLELDPDQLKQRIEVAQEAIRRQMVALDHRGQITEDRQSLEDALRTLNLLQRRK
jgi:hypothetical protein